MIKIKNVGVWPVGLVGGLNVETPVLDPQSGKYYTYNICDFNSYSTRTR